MVTGAYPVTGTPVPNEHSNNKKLRGHALDTGRGGGHGCEGQVGELTVAKENFDRKRRRPCDNGKGWGVDPSPIQVWGRGWVDAHLFSPGG